MKKVGIFGSEYQADKQLVIKRLFEKLASLEAEVFVDRDFYLFLTDALNYEPPVSGILTSDEFDLVESGRRRDIPAYCRQGE